VQNLREESKPHHEATGPRSDSRQVIAVVLAAVLVAIALSAVGIVGARLDPGGADCVLTDNAGCVSVGSDGPSADQASGPESKGDGEG
jgi:hypothetical protein